MTIDTHTLDCALAGYIECALWSSGTDSGGNLDDDYCADDITDESRATMLAEVTAFMDKLNSAGLLRSALMTMGPNAIGHNFWLTRNRHGTGFWDYGLDELGERLTAAAQKFDDACLFVNDDDKLTYSVDTLL